MLAAVSTVSDEPCIDLTRWTVVETESGERHLVGCNAATGLGRVSSAIDRFDAATMQFTTNSGRVYRVANVGDVSRDAWYAWEAWASFNAVRSWREVTDEYEVSMPAHSAHQATVH